jgi:hypothetical protein
MKLCKDCKWARDIGGLTYVWGCANEACGSKIDPVDGGRFYKLCSAARREDAACGPEMASCGRREMARFYVGQPVTCIGTFDHMRSAAQRCGLQFDYPVKGQRYTVGGYNSGDHRLLHVAEIPLRQGRHDVYWGETQFAPITDEQVRDIIEEAHKMGPWTGGVHWDEKTKEEQDA